MSLSKIDLTGVDDELMAHIMKKFDSVRTGGRFYRSCRTAGPLVEWAKPVWPLPALVDYYEDKKFTHNFQNHKINDGSFSELPLKLCRFEYVTVRTCSEDTLNEVKSMGAVERLSFCPGSRQLPVDKVKDIFTAAKPEEVDVFDDFFELHSDIFKDVKNLVFYHYVRSTGNKLFWNPTRMYEIMRTRKTIIWCNCTHPMRTLNVLLRSWLNGSNTGSLETLTYCFEKELDFPYVQKILKQVWIKKLMKSCIKQKDAVVLGRKEGGHLRVAIRPSSGGAIDFCFLGE